MNSVVSFAIFAVLLLSLVQLGSTSFSFAGTWLDNRGYTVSLCVTHNGTRLQGSFQQFGIIQGEISDNGRTARGRWYEARNPLSSCPTGGFTFKLQNSNHWEGNFDCADEANVGDNYIWDGDRYSPDITPSDVDCAVLIDNRADIEGAWIVNPSISTYWDICTDDRRKFRSSYECDTALNCKGYEEGFTYENGRILIGGFTNVYPDGNVVDGSAIVALLNNSRLVHYQWASPITPSRVISFTQHVAEFNIVYSNNTIQEECVRNLDIYSDLYLRFSSVPNGFTVISGADDDRDPYDAPDDDNLETSDSSQVTLCFILATIILILI